MFRWVRSLAVDPGNEFFATGSADRTIKIWDLASGQLKLTLTGHIEQVWRALPMQPHTSHSDLNISLALMTYIEACTAGCANLSGVKTSSVQVSDCTCVHCAGDRNGAVAQASIYVLMRPGQAGQVLGPGVQQGTVPHIDQTEWAPFCGPPQPEAYAINIMIGPCTNAGASFGLSRDLVPGSSLGLSRRPADVFMCAGRSSGSIMAT